MQSAPTPTSEPPLEQRLERLRPWLRRRVQSAKQRRNWFWLTDLDELVQEVCVRFWQAVADQRFEYRDEEQLKGYLLRTVYFAAMRIKDRWALERPVSEFLSDDEAARAREEFDLSAFAGNAFDSYGRRECLRELYQAIAQLVPARADVLRYTLLGLAPHEIAGHLQRSANAVSVLKFHAIRDLAAQLQSTDFGANCGRYFLGPNEGLL